MSSRVTFFCDACGQCVPQAIVLVRAACAANGWRYQHACTTKCRDEIVARDKKEIATP